MFDARSLLDALVRGGPPSQGQGTDLSAISEILQQLGQGQDPTQRDPSQRGAPPGRPAGGYAPDDVGAGFPPGPGGGAARRQDSGAEMQGGGLEDILRNVLGGEGGAGLQDILTKLQQQGGSLRDILGQILGQGAGAPTAAAGRAGDVGGASPEDLLAQIKKLLADNQLAAGAALGGLGAVLLGTQTGRSLAGSAIKLGGLALVGSLAYKAYQNYQQGRPILPGASPEQQALVAPPQGSGFEAGAVTHEGALLLIRAMIAAAAADGRIDAKEQQSILGGMKQAGIADDAQRFLAREINNPATVDQLADAVASPQEALQVYTAARISVDPDLEEEHEFLSSLADRLGIDETLAAHIDRTARAAGA